MTGPRGPTSERARDSGRACPCPRDRSAIAPTPERARRRRHPRDERGARRDRCWLMCRTDRRARATRQPPFRQIPFPTPRGAERIKHSPHRRSSRPVVGARRSLHPPMRCRNSDEPRMPPAPPIDHVRQLAWCSTARPTPSRRRGRSARWVGLPSRSPAITLSDSRTPGGTAQRRPGNRRLHARKGVRSRSRD